MSLKRVCIIGGGASGLIALYHVRRKGLQGVLFEQNDYIGGVWKYSQQSPLYASLVTNLPKEVMQYHVDFPFADDLPSFLQHADVLEYLESFAAKTLLEPHIRLNTSVIDVSRGDGDLGRWKVTLQTSDEVPTAAFFDAVIVCNGHFNVPEIPSIPGLDNYKGILMHSMQYKTPEMFHDKKVLIVGVKSSGTDITREVANFASHVHICDRRYTTTTLSPIGHTIHGAIDYVTNDGGFKMISGEVVRVDAVIFCTGYEYSVPFLSIDITTTPKSVQPLYEHVFYTSDPSLSFVGLPMTVIPFPLCYLQSLWIASVLNDEVSLPSCDEMECWRSEFENELMSKNGYPRGYHILSMGMFPYMRRIASTIFNEEELEHELRYIQVLEEIYENVGSHRPCVVGDDDRYRRRNYDVDYAAGTWKVYEPKVVRRNNCDVAAVQFDVNDESEAHSPTSSKRYI